MHPVQARAAAVRRRARQAAVHLHGGKALRPPPSHLGTAVPTADPGGARITVVQRVTWEALLTTWAARRARGPVFDEERFRVYQSGRFGPPPSPEVARAQRIVASRALRAALSADQWRTLQDRGVFTVVGSQSRERYAVHCCPPGNIWRVTDGTRYCLAHEVAWVPVATLLLCQATLLRVDEPRFLRTANRLAIATPRDVESVNLDRYYIQLVCDPEHEGPWWPWGSGFERHVVVRPPPVTAVGS